MKLLPNNNLKNLTLNLNKNFIGQLLNNTKELCNGMKYLFSNVQYLKLDLSFN